MTKPMAPHSALLITLLDHASGFGYIKHQYHLSSVVGMQQCTPSSSKTSRCSTTAAGWSSSPPQTQIGSMADGIPALHRTRRRPMLLRFSPTPSHSMPAEDALLCSQPIASIAVIRSLLADLLVLFPQTLN